MKPVHGFLVNSCLFWCWSISKEKKFPKVSNLTVSFFVIRWLNINDLAWIFDSWLIYHHTNVDNYMLSPCHWFSGFHSCKQKKTLGIACIKYLHLTHIVYLPLRPFRKKTHDYRVTWLIWARPYKCEIRSEIKTETTHFNWLYHMISRHFEMALGEMTFYQSHLYTTIGFRILSEHSKDSGIETGVNVIILQAYWTINPSYQFYLYMHYKKIR